MTTEKLTNEYLTTGEAARLLGVSGSRIRQLVMEGKLKAKVWKGLALRKEDVLALKNRPGPGKPKKIHGLRQPEAEKDKTPIPARGKITRGKERG